MNELKDYANIFEGIQPFTGPVSGGYLIDFLGTRTDANFRTMFGVEPASVGGGPVQTNVPTIIDGEGWFEAVNWVAAGPRGEEPLRDGHPRRMLWRPGRRQLSRAAGD